MSVPTRISLPRRAGDVSAGGELAGLRVSRPLTADRRVWAGLHVSAESLIGGLDTAPEVVAMTSGRWSLVKLLGLALARVGRPAAVEVWSWTLSRRAIARLQAWHRAGVTVRVAVDSSLWRRQPSYGEALVADGFGERVRAFSNHAKAATVFGPAGSIFLAGSGNLNLARRAELLWLSEDAALCSWLVGLTDRLFAALPAGAPVGSATLREARVAKAFPPTTVRPSWAEKLPVLR